MFLDTVFCSIQGESSESGLPCIFIRLYGCPIGCVYCDQPQGLEQKKKVSLDKIISMVKKYKGVNYICITGGEPLIQPEVYPLIFELQHLGYRISVETSGCVPIDFLGYHRSFKYVMDIKCPSSMVSEKNVYENLIKLQGNDEVKFVIADRKDYDFMKKVLQRYNTQASILVSPMFNSKNQAVIGKELVEWLLEDRLNYRVQIQLHKILGVL